MRGEHKAAPRADGVDDALNLRACRHLWGSEAG
jgi:hypothetical protein